MSPKDLLVIAATMFVCFCALYTGFRMNVIGRGQPKMDELVFTNGTGRTVSRLFANAGGAQEQELLHGSFLAPGAKAVLRIDRWPLPNAADMKIVYADGSEKLWPGLPMRGVFSLEADSRGEPRFEDRTVCS
jgi:hypothetical protein